MAAASDTIIGRVSELSDLGRLIVTMATPAGSRSTTMSSSGAAVFIGSAVVEIRSKDAPEGRLIGEV
ncbi:hypothetical protein B296_00045885 [Ensete ventricosum]|uniref:Uncharacterized protein n=1 Tax=Ensete ventricosum TaxID=4639 RepID=A0A426YR28_ENSVE|nr:hypothetical protein B296_00045885 [Ensete ventricosum]